MDILEKDKEYLAGCYNRYPAVLVRGKGSRVFDRDGKEYIDMGAGIGVNSFGYCDETWVKAVTEQLSVLQHTSNLYYTVPGVELSEILCKKSGMKKCFYGNSGAEANEAAIKAARKYSFDKYKDEERKEIITLKRSFHGRTLATLKATGQEEFHTIFGPFPEGFLYCEPDNFDEFLSLYSEKTCAVMMEVIQGEGGVNVLSRDFVKKVVEFSNEHDIIVIIDEVQSGNGRTGKMYAYQHFDITPDIVTTAKGVAGGLPMGVCMLGEKVKDTLTLGSHGSTFGMNPAVAAGALSIVKRLDDEFLAEVKKKSDYIVERLNSCENVKSVSGLGLMLGIETTKPAGDIVNECLDKGVLCLTAKTKVRLLPPLNISPDDLEKALNIITEVIG